jgi:hypothetical protein
MDGSAAGVKIAINGDVLLIAMAGETKMRALFHVLFVVPLAAIALLAFLVVLTVKAIQDMAAFKPTFSAAYAKHPIYVQRSSRNLEDR